jgi:uncharacterized membrane protein
MFDFEGHSSETLKELLSGITLVISWVSVQVIFALYYAHKFYDRNVEHGNNGFTFPNNPLPDYWNFIRFAFVIGMRIQVPRVQVTSKTMRRVVLAHSVLSFILSVAILVLASFLDGDHSIRAERDAFRQVAPYSSDSTPISFFSN